MRWGWGWALLRRWTCPAQGSRFRGDCPARCPWSPVGWTVPACGSRSPEILTKHSNCCEQSQLGALVSWWALSGSTPLLQGPSPGLLWTLKWDFNLACRGVLQAPEKCEMSEKTPQVMEVPSLGGLDGGGGAVAEQAACSSQGDDPCPPLQGHRTGGVQ